MSKNFKFKLETVLDIKVKRENEHIISHSKIANKKIKIEKTIRELQESFDEHGHIERTAPDVTHRQMACIYKNFLYESIETKERELELVNVEFEKSKEELIIRQAERKSLEKLKENKYQEFLLEVEEEEQLENDEFSSQLYFRENFL